MIEGPTKNSWLHTSPVFPPGEWSAGWTDSGGPDFSPDPASTSQASVVTELVEAIGLEKAAWAKQVHGATIVRVSRPGLAGEADGLWTDIPGLGVIGRSADCPLVLVGGKRRDGSRVWGFTHASWRSTIQGITGKLVGLITDAGTDPTTLTATICPSAGPCCYEVGPEVLEAAVTLLGSEVRKFFHGAGTRWILDLWALNTAQLTAAGVSPGSIHIAGKCTICGGSRYPSYRRDGADAGRFAAIIGWNQLRNSP
ncbi:MAG: polyphenol oxidase family protein [Gemmatimonadales bacterium]|nr:polyphenol oxidase family protein [Gemmatimonadales bacterium]